jgi:hypothetical protein
MYPRKVLDFNDTVYLKWRGVGKRFKRRRNWI